MQNHLNYKKEVCGNIFEPRGIEMMSVTQTSSGGLMALRASKIGVHAVLIAFRLNKARNGANSLQPHTTHDM